MEKEILELLMNHIGDPNKILEVRNKLLDLFSVSNSTLEYKDNVSAGTVAKEYNVTVGELGCKKCGCVVHGAITRNACDWCGTKYFD